MEHLVRAMLSVLVRPLEGFVVLMVQGSTEGVNAMENLQAAVGHVLVQVEAVVLKALAVRAQGIPI